MRDHSPRTSDRLRRIPSEVAYVLTSAYDVAHFGPVCNALNARGIRTYFVLQKPVTWHRSLEKRREKLDHYERMRELLASNGLPIADYLNPRADIALTTQSADGVRSCRNFKLKAPYGAPTIKEDTQFLSEKCYGFDGFLVHGQLQKETHAKDFPASRMKAIGIPKYDAFFQQPPDASAIKRRLGIAHPSKKPIITYLPTWDVRNSTIHSFHQAFMTLRSKYTIVIKPHPHTQKLNHRTGEVDKLRQISPHVLDPCDATEDAVVIAHLVITDVKSGVTSESIYLTSGKTPWIGVTPYPDDAFFDAVTAAGPLVHDSGTLPNTIDRLLKTDRYRDSRVAFSRYCYSDNAGHAAEDAADAIIDFAQMQVISRKVPYAWKKLKRSIKKRTQRLRGAA